MFRRVVFEKLRSVAFLNLKSQIQEGGSRESQEGGNFDGLQFSFKNIEHNHLCKGAS